VLTTVLEATMTTRTKLPAAALFLAVSVAALIAATPVQAAAPATGDAYVYQLTNGYSKEILGRIRYEVDRTAADRVVFLVTPDTSAAGVQRTEIRTPQGNWLRGLLESHGVPVEYEFTTAYPAFVFPLDPGKRWSVRVNATVTGPTRNRSVRVDGLVVGTERIRVPAGEFDTVKIKRMVYPGDADFRTAETQIVEFDWYAPALGRAVRTERRSTWIDISCHEDGVCDGRGEWSVLELVTPPR
jgi:hypothetical protein